MNSRIGSAQVVRGGVLDDAVAKMEGLGDGVGIDIGKPGMILLL